MIHRFFLHGRELHLRRGPKELIFQLEFHTDPLVGDEIVCQVLASGEWREETLKVTGRQHVFPDRKPSYTDDSHELHIFVEPT